MQSLEVALEPPLYTRNDILPDVDEELHDQEQYQKRTPKPSLLMELEGDLESVECHTLLCGIGEVGSLALQCSLSQVQDSEADGNVHIYRVSEDIVAAVFPATISPRFANDIAKQILRRINPERVYVLESMLHSIYVPSKVDGSSQLINSVVSSSLDRSEVLFPLLHPPNLVDSTAAALLVQCEMSGIGCELCVSVKRPSCLFEACAAFEVVFERLRMSLDREQLLQLVKRKEKLNTLFI